LRRRLRQQLAAPLALKRALVVLDPTVGTVHGVISRRPIGAAQPFPQRCLAGTARSEPARSATGPRGDVRSSRAQLCSRARSSPAGDRGAGSRSDRHVLHTSRRSGTCGAQSRCLNLPWVACFETSPNARPISSHVAPWLLASETASSITKGRC
jgi:hypothetical protein